MTDHATLVVPLPDRPDQLLLYATTLIDQTPGDLFDVAFVNLGAPQEVVDLLKSFSGDVEVITNTSLADAVNQIAASNNGLVIVMESSTELLQPGWLEALLLQPKSRSVADNLVTLLPRESDQFSRLWQISRTQPSVLRGLQPTSSADFTNIGAHSQTPVGELPLAETERIRDRLLMEEERRLLEIVRDGRDTCWIDDGEDEPLVSVRIATYNRGQTIVDTAITSILAQTYERFELIIVGDHCDEATEKAVLSVNDPRITFFNLPQRGIYPKDPWLRWLVAGATPMNFGNEIAKGAWIAPCDDDDEFTPDHLEVLLREAKSRRLEMAWSKAKMETPEGWDEVGAEPLGPGNVSHGTVMYSAGLKFMRMSTTCWKINEPSDGNFWRHMTGIGVRTGFVDHVTYRHYLEGRFRENVQGPQKYE